MENDMENSETVKMAANGPVIIATTSRLIYLYFTANIKPIITTIITIIISLPEIFIVHLLHIS